MLISVFKSNQKLVNVFIVFLTVIFWIPAFVKHIDVDSNLISTNIKWLDILIAIFLIAFQAIYLNFIVNEYKLIKENSHLTSLMFVLINCSCILFSLNQVIVANTFIVLAFHQLLRISKSKNNSAILFNAAFLFSLATLVHPQNLVFLCLALIALFYSTTASWRDVTILIIGFSVPLVYFFSYHFVFYDLFNFTFSPYSRPLFNFDLVNLSLFDRLSFIVVGILFLFALRSMVSAINNSVVRIRKTLVIVVLMLFFGLTTLFISGFDYLATFLTISIPLAILFATFFQSIKKNWFAEVLFMLLFGIVILGYFS